MSGNRAFKGRSRGLSEGGAAATTGTKRGAGGLEAKTVLRICWRLSSKYLTMKELPEPEVAGGATTSTAAQVGARVAAEVWVQQSLSLVGVLQASLSLPL